VEVLSLQAIPLFMAKNMEAENVTFAKIAEHIRAHTDQDRGKHSDFWQMKK
jgi:hypothetical protein